MKIEQIGFPPLFYLLDLIRDEHGRLRSIAVEKIDDVGYYGVSFTEDNTGWSVNPIKVGRGFIGRSKFDFTESFDEAVKHSELQTTPISKSPPTTPQK